MTDFSKKKKSSNLKDDSKTPNPASIINLAPLKTKSEYESIEPKAPDSKE